MANKPSTVVQVIPVEFIERKIYLIRDYKVMLDSDVAELYQVPTKVLNQAVRRNLDRFPADFMFQLNDEELENWEVTNCDLQSRGEDGTPPPAVRLHRAWRGVAMLSSVLTSKRAVELNILIIRAFVRLREYLATHKDLARKPEDVKRTQQEHSVRIQQIYDYIQRLLEPGSETSEASHRLCDARETGRIGRGVAPAKRTCGVSWQPMQRWQAHSSRSAIAA